MEADRVRVPLLLVGSAADAVVTIEEVGLRLCAAACNLDLRLWSHFYYACIRPVDRGYSPVLRSCC